MFTVILLFFYLSKCYEERGISIKSFELLQNPADLYSPTEKLYSVLHTSEGWTPFTKGKVKLGVVKHLPGGNWKFMLGVTAL